jgi:hypothetical protein
MGIWMSRDKTRRKHLFLLPPEGALGGARAPGRPDRERGYDTRRSPLRLAAIVKSSHHVLVFGGSKIQTMMHNTHQQPGSEAAAAQTVARHESHGAPRATATRIVLGKSSLTSAGSPKLAFSVSPIACSVFAVA